MNERERETDHLFKQNLPMFYFSAPSAAFLLFRTPTASISFPLLAECRRRRFPPLRRNCHDLPCLPSDLRCRCRFSFPSAAADLYLPLFPPPLPDLALDTFASLLCYPRRAPTPSLFSLSLPISLSCRCWILEANHLPSLLSPRPPFTCATASLLDLLPSLSVSSSPTRRLLLPSSPSPSSPSSTSPLPWSSSATLFLPDVLPVGDLGIRKGVQILRHLRTANPMSPLTCLLSLSSVAATTTVGPGPSSIADRRRLLDLLLRRAAVASPSTSSLLVSVLRRYPRSLSSSR